MSVNIRRLLSKTVNQRALLVSVLLVLSFGLSSIALSSDSDNNDWQNDWREIRSSNDQANTDAAASDASNEDEWQEVRSSNDEANAAAVSSDDNNDYVWQEVHSTKDQTDTFRNQRTHSRSGDRAGFNGPVEELPRTEPRFADPVILDFGNDGSVGQNNEQSDEPVLPGDITNQPFVPSTTDVTNVDMFVGELLVLGEVDVTRVAIGNGSIVRAEILKTNELLVIGQQEGSTSLRLWNKDDTQTAYNIRVGAQDPETRIHMERMVRLRVRMVEFNARAIGRLGIDWVDNINGPTFAAAGDAIGNNLFRPAAEGFTGLPNTVDPFATYFGIATSITSKINFLSGNGDAITLAEPVLSAVNGGQASFLAGGEIPFPTVGNNGQTSIEFKEYGIRLQVAPTIDSGGNIRTLVDTEISKQPLK